MSKTDGSGEVRIPTRIRGIYIRRLTFSLSDDFNPLVGGQLLTAESGVDQQVLLETSNKTDERLADLTYVTRFGFRVKLTKTAEGEPSDSEIARVEADIAVAFTDLPDDFVGRVREEFGATAVVRMSWPYWREVLQSSLSRMQLPSMVLPPMVSVKEVTKAGDQQANVPEAEKSKSPE